MKISELSCDHVMSCTVHDTLDRAAQLMWDVDVGCLPVIDDQGQVAGMVTDRDICMAAYTQGTPLRAIPVTSAMSAHVYACSPDEAITAVAQRMRLHQVRRMPVVNDQGHPVGIVSLTDLTRAVVLGQLPSTELINALAEVCAPRTMAPEMP